MKLKHTALIIFIAFNSYQCSPRSEAKRNPDDPSNSSYLSETKLSEDIKSPKGIKPSEDIKSKPSSAKISFSPDNITVSNTDLNVKLNSDQPGDIYYTLDGLEPTTQSSKYTDGIAIKGPKAGLSIRAAVLIDGQMSDVSTKWYAVEYPTPGKVEFSIISGTYDHDIEISLTTKKENSKIFYRRSDTGEKKEFKDEKITITGNKTQITISAYAELNDLEGESTEQTYKIDYNQVSTPQIAIYDQNNTPIEETDDGKFKFYQVLNLIPQTSTEGATLQYRVSENSDWKTYSDTKKLQLANKQEITLYVQAIKDGMHPSATIMKKFSLDNTMTAPQFDLTPGPYLSDSLSIPIIKPMENMKIFYKLENQNNFTELSNLTIKIDKTSKVTIYGLINDVKTEEVTAMYALNEVIFSPESKTFDSNFQVTITAPKNTTLVCSAITFAASSANTGETAITNNANTSNDLPNCSYMVESNGQEKIVTILGGIKGNASNTSYISRSAHTYSYNSHQSDIIPLFVSLASKGLTKIVFHGPIKNISGLSLNNNKLSSVDISEITSLTSLYIFNNLMTELILTKKMSQDGNDFIEAKPSNLQHLYLGMNNLKKIPTDLEKYKENLRSLDLMFNPIQYENYKDFWDQINAFINLSNFSFGSNRYGEEVKATYQDSDGKRTIPPITNPKLITLNLSYLGLEKIPAISASNQLISLSFYGNKLTTLEKSSFAPYTKLEALTLSNNLLKSIDLTSLPSLKILSIRDNKDLDLGDFSGLPKTLTDLSLTQTNTSINENIKSLSALKKLMFGNNPNIIWTRLLETNITSYEFNAQVDSPNGIIDPCFLLALYSKNLVAKNITLTSYSSYSINSQKPQYPSSMTKDGTETPLATILANFNLSASSSFKIDPQLPSATCL